jgi:hypothetical protein
MLAGSLEIASKSPTAVAAELLASEIHRLSDLIGVGGAIQFVTANSTYSTFLQRAHESMQSLPGCRIEADHLGGAQAG